MKENYYYSNSDSKIYDFQNKKYFDLSEKIWKNDISNEEFY